MVMNEICCGVVEMIVVMLMFGMIGWFVMLL